MILTVRDTTTGRAYKLDRSKPLAEGGEAFVYNVQGEPSVVAKLYKDPRPERAQKLAFMLAHPPTNPTAAQNHQAYAWPTALLSSQKTNSVIGFLMPRVTGMKEVFTFYNPRARRETCAAFDYRYLMQTARNIAGVMAELHSRGYLIADVSQKNVLVSDRALVTVLDNDSFEFRDPETNFLHLCNVRTPGFIAPEGYAAARNDPRTVDEDRFALAVLVFHLLMEGVHPFTCKYKGPGDAPRLQQNVVAGRFPYDGVRTPDFEPMPAAPPFRVLPPELRALFGRCFVNGHKTPSVRPTAREWQRALSDASKNLVRCQKNELHYYGSHLGSECPWCSRVQIGFREPWEKVTVPPRPPKRPDPPKQPSREVRAPNFPQPRSGSLLLKILKFVVSGIGLLFFLAAVLDGC